MLDQSRAPKRELLLPLLGYAAILAFFFFAYWDMGGGRPSAPAWPRFRWVPRKAARPFECSLWGSLATSAGSNP